MPPLTAKNIGFPGVSSPVRLRRGLDQSESVWFPEGLEPEKEILLSRLINMPVSATCGSSWRIRLQDQLIATLRYLDTFAKVDGAWLLAERRLYVDWIEERTLS